MSVLDTAKNKIDIVKYFLDYNKIDYSINNYNSLSDIVINIRLKTKEYSIDFNDIDLIFNRLNNYFKFLARV